jgi:hypothetical protein
VKESRKPGWLHSLSCALAVGGWLVLGTSLPAAQVTVITHGLNGTTTGWITGMARAMTNRPGGSADAVIYRLQVTGSGASFSKLAGGDPLATTSGDIIVLLDWGAVAGGNSFNTTEVANAVLPLLTVTSALPELGGRALVSWPLHLIGHSRGGSLVCELSRVLGEQGIWVDQVTTLDAHPLNNGFNDWIYSDEDASALTYENVLFADSYYQTTSFVHGLAATGAFWRRQTNFSGGYTELASGPHSDIHLWYHATIDLASPVSDSEATLTATDRQFLWTTGEQRGTNAGHRFAVSGGGDRTLDWQPSGTQSSRIRDGFNQRFDLGLSLASNRSNLTSNAGLWPNPIRFDLLTSNAVPADVVATARIYFQWARPVASNQTVTMFLDADTNPWNGNEQLLTNGMASGTTAAQVGAGTMEFPLAAASVPPGQHRVVVRMTEPGGRSRFLYAPQVLSVLPSDAAPWLDLADLGEGQLRLGVNGQVGQTLVLEVSNNLFDWTAIVTQTLAVARWELNVTNSMDAHFFRAVK